MLHNLSKIVLSTIVLLLVVTEVVASEVIATKDNSADVITINSTNKAPLFDGRCDKDEWNSAIKLITTIK